MIIRITPDFTSLALFTLGYMDFPEHFLSFLNLLGIHFLTFNLDLVSWIVESHSLGLTLGFIPFAVFADPFNVRLFTVLGIVVFGAYNTFRVWKAAEDEAKAKAKDEAKAKAEAEAETKAKKEKEEKEKEKEEKEKKEREKQIEKELANESFSSGEEDLYSKQEPGQSRFYDPSSSETEAEAERAVRGEEKAEAKAKEEAKAKAEGKAEPKSESET